MLYFQRTQQSLYERTFEVKTDYCPKLHRDDRQHKVGLDLHSEVNILIFYQTFNILKSYKLSKNINQMCMILHVCYALYFCCFSHISRNINCRTKEKRSLSVAIVYTENVLQLTRWAVRQSTQKLCLSRKSFMITVLKLDKDKMCVGHCVQPISDILSSHVISYLVT